MGADWDATLAQLFKQLEEKTSSATYEHMLRNGDNATAASFNLEVGCMQSHLPGLHDFPLSQQCRQAVDHVNLSLHLLVKHNCSKHQLQVGSSCYKSLPFVAPAGPSYSCPNSITALLHCACKAMMCAGRCLGMWAHPPLSRQERQTVDSHQ